MLVHVPAKSKCQETRWSPGPKSLIVRCLVASFPLLLPWLSPLLSFAEVPDCLVVEPRSEPSGEGRYDHSMTFMNGCPVRIYLTTRRSDVPDSPDWHNLLATGETVTVILSHSQPTRAFRARYEARFASRSEGRSRSDRGAGTVRAAASRAATGSRGETRSRAKTPPAPAVSSGPPASSLPLDELCRRAMRKIVTLDGLSENDSKLKELVDTCPARVNRDPEKRRAELECVLKTSPREGVGSCFGTN